MKYLKNKRILITGAGGTVGKELLSQIIKCKPKEVIGLDNNESELFFLGETYRDYNNARFYLADMRDLPNLQRKMNGIDIVFHTAALKHVLLCEHSPVDAIQTNITGTQNVIDAAIHAGVERVLFTSSDKAVNPTNVMGTSKLMGERLMTAANAHKRNEGPIFASTRFGNVLGSRGSVIPLFKKQIANSGPVTLTDNEMSRFIMTLEEAVSLVLESASLCYGGEVFVTKMPSIRIEDLAYCMIDILAEKDGFDPTSIEIRISGAKAGEKLYEELLNSEEIRRTLELKKYFTILPAFKSVYQNIEYNYSNIISQQVDRAYNSQAEQQMGRNELKHYLIDNNLV